MTDTKEAMLDAGVRLFGVQAGDLLKGLTAGTVAQEAGFHRQTFYRYWDTQAEYVQDLIRHLMAPPTRLVADGVAVVAERRTGTAADMASFIHDMARFDFARVLEDRQAAMRVGLLMMEALTGGATGARTQRYYDQTMDLVASHYDLLLEGWDLEPRPPITSRDLGRMLQALLLGLVVQVKSASDDPHGAEIFETAAVALLTSLTQPRSA